MLKNAKRFHGGEVRATNGAVGKLRDLYFDDQQWKVRYLAIDAGLWMSGRQVLVAPIAAGAREIEEGVLTVNLTQEQVRNSPEIDTQRPVSRQEELRLHQHYGWPYYWEAPYINSGMGTPVTVAVAPEAPPLEQPLPPDRVAPAEGVAPAEESHLRSAEEVIGYHIEASDGSIGHVEDLLFDEESWTVRYLIVDTRNWWAGRKVLVSPQWIGRILWADSSVVVDLTRDAVKGSPEYDPSHLPTTDYTDRLHDHYGRPRETWSTSAPSSSSPRGEVRRVM